MHLVVRPMLPDDIETCATFPLLDEIAYDKETRDLLPVLWRELLTTGYTESCLVEDMDRAPGDRTVAFGIIPFISQDFLDEFLQAPRPYFNRVIVDKWREGRSPLLNKEQVARANAGQGVNMHCFHETVLTGDVFSKENLPIVEKLIESMFQMSSGYNVNSFSTEVYGDIQLQLNLNGGFLLRTNYAEYYQTHPAPEMRPSFVSLTREESRTMVGVTLTMLFHYQPPRIFFRPQEQEQLHYALLDMTDEDIAQQLNIALITVRKRWLTMYDRVDMAIPELLPQGSLEGGAERTRGSEKRRRLLSYVRTHKEELRPIFSPK